MDREDSRALEVVIAEKVLARLRAQVMTLYALSLALGLGLGATLLWQHRAISGLADARLSEYRLLVAEKIDELHELDLEEVARRTRPQERCAQDLPRPDAASFLTAALGREAAAAEIDPLLEKAREFGICDIGEVQHIWDDTETMARVETVYRLLLHRPPDPVGRFIYGYWLASGVSVEAVARDIMSSPEFHRLRKLSGS